MFSALIEKLLKRDDIATEEAAAAMLEIMDGRAGEGQIAGFLVALAMKGERASEIVGLARTMRGRAVALSKRYGGVFDTCGTGGDRSSTFNISSCHPLVLAAGGVPASQH